VSGSSQQGHSRFSNDKAAVTPILKHCADRFLGIGKGFLFAVTLGDNFTRPGREQ
jgi:hypothetical protein